MPSRLRRLCATVLNPSEGHSYRQQHSSEVDGCFSTSENHAPRRLKTDCISDLTSLPQELTNQICGYMAVQDIRSLSRCCKHIFNSTLPLLYRQISIDMTAANLVETTLIPWTRLLQQRRALSLVRDVIIKGRKWSHGPCILRFKPGLDERLMHPSRQPVSKGKFTFMNRLYMDDYSAVTEFLHSLPCLTAVEFSVQDVVPPLLLTHFRKNSQICVHFSGMVFSPVFALAEELVGVFALPSLASISVAYCRSETMEHDFLIMEKTLEALVRAAPNLRSVQLGMHQGIFSSLPWADAVLEALDKRLTRRWIKAKLESLAIAQNQLRSLASTNPSAIMLNLDKLIDTSCLRSLKLFGFLGPDLHWMAKNCSFPGVKELELKMHLELEDIERWDEATNAAKTFLSSLPPLSTLRLLRVARPEDLADILEEHRSSLTNLAMFSYRDMYAHAERYYTFDAATVLMSLRDCYSLESLELEVRHDLSDIKENEVYHSFQSLPALQSLTLHMDCTTGELSQKGVHRCLRSPAFDETFALSIWDLVTCGKVGKQLTKLRIYPDCRSHIFIANQVSYRMSQLRLPAYVDMASTYNSYKVMRIFDADGPSGVRVRKFGPEDVLGTDL